MRIAVEGEEAARFQRASGQGVIEVLSRRIAIDLNRHAALYRCREHGVPIGNDAGARPRDPTARVRQDANRRMRDGCDHAFRLVLVPAESRMRRSQYHVEDSGLVVRQVQLTRGVNVRFDAL